MIAEVVESNGKFYITPLRVQLNGMSWANKADADYICRAVNAAYERGREESQRDLRDRLNVAGRAEGE